MSDTKEYTALQEECERLRAENQRLNKCLARYRAKYGELSEPDKKNAATCIFEPPLCADYSRETRVKFVNPLCNGATDQDTDKKFIPWQKIECVPYIMII